MIIDLEETFTIGEDTFLDSVAEPFAVAFEDDLETGYFYAYDMSKNDDQILDALHIYDVESVVGKSKPCILQIAWSDDKTIASLLIDTYCHAIFDFKNKRSYSRNGYPECLTDWSTNADRILTEELINEVFKDRK